MNRTHSTVLCGLLLGLAAPVSFSQDRGPRGERDRGGDSEDIWKTLAEKYDADADNRIARDEYARGGDKFDLLDRNRDGALTAEDFSGGSRGRRRGGIDFGSMMGPRIARGADADENGAVTEEEWKAFLKSLAKDDTGVIDLEILTSKVSLSGFPGRRGRGNRGPGGPGGPGQGFPERMAGMLDRDDDGELEVSDIDSFFADLDRDKSGVLEESELADRGRGGRSSGGTPQAGDAAPDFELAYAKDAGKSARLSSFAGKRPVALVFGSYT